MDYKEKYKAALERARKFSEHPLQEDSAAIVEYIFPELEEPEDENKRISKEISRFLKQNNGWNNEWLTWLEKQGQTFTKKDVDDAYLKGIFDAKHEIEKQGEQGHAELGQSEVTKTSDQDLEPKFKVGDCVISNDGTHTYIVKERKRGAYVMLDIGDNEEFSIIIETADRTGRFWTIQDAKDGDVLVNGSNVFIFHLLNNTRLMGYCHVNIDDGRFYDDVGRNECFCLIDAIVTPATKEQRDLLFHKMKDAGYEWDSKNKELKKIESKKLDAAEVIEWLEGHYGDEILVDLVEQFKQDFGL